MQNINASGGIHGRPVQLVWHDTGQESLDAAARALASDSSIQGVVGPKTSADTFAVAPLFFAAHKALITPSATAADLFRAFAGRPNNDFWRTIEPDTAQVRVMLEQARSEGAQSVALVGSDDLYGNTFFDWFGFFASQLGIRTTTNLRFNEAQTTCDASMSQALATHPDVLLAVPTGAPAATCMAKAWLSNKQNTRLMFSDSAEEPALLAALGPQAAGIEGTAPAPDPNTGFTAAYQQMFQAPPPNYAANSYDAVTLLAYGLATGAGQSDLGRAITGVVAQRGPPTGSDQAGIAAALNGISHGTKPNISGASGPLDYDTHDFVEPTSSFYTVWHVDGGKFIPIKTLSTAATPTALADRSITTTPPAPAAAQATVGGAYRPPPRTGSWALLVAASTGWENYRHQADVLAQYDLLRSRGVPADHIIVVAANDIATNPANPHQGQVIYQPGGRNLWSPAFRPDYAPTAISAEDLAHILSGVQTPATPRVIQSGPGDDVYVFVAGHGDQSGVFLGLSDPVPNPEQTYSVLSPQLVGSTVSNMAAQRRYGRMLVAVEACQGGVLGSQLNAPGALVVSGANSIEDSIATNYDLSVGNWLADQFAYVLWQAQSQNPNASLGTVLPHLYLEVSGSHVTAQGPSFGDATTTSLGSFISP